MPSKSQTVGLDFGTSTTLIARSVSGNRAEVVPIGTAGTDFIPSVARIEGDDLLVGEQAVDRPGEIRSVKNCITLVSGGCGDAEPVADKAIRAILAETVSRYRSSGEPFDPRFVRLGCPASWQLEERQRLVRLAKEAGLDLGLNQVVDEPVAVGVAWAWGMDHQVAEPPQGHVLVIDFGGGTVDLALLRLDREGNRLAEMSVLAADSVLDAGDKLDQLLAGHLEREWARAGVSDEELSDPAVRQAVLAEARRAKELLSVTESVSAQYRPHRSSAASVPDVELDRRILNDYLNPELAGLGQAIERLLRHAELPPRLDAARAAARDDQECGNAVLVPVVAEVKQLPLASLTRRIDHVVLAGGMTAIPRVREWIGELIGDQSEVHETLTDSGAADMVARGLAMDAPYDVVNMHLPSFEIVLERQIGKEVHSEVLYPGYTPIYRDYQVLAEMPLEFSGRLPRGSVPSGPARLSARVIGARSRDVDFREPSVDGRSGSADDSTTVTVDSTMGNSFKITPSGDFTWYVGARTQTTLYLKDWRVGSLGTDNPAPLVRFSTVPSGGWDPSLPEHPHK